AHSLETKSSSIFLNENQIHKLTIKYFDATGGSYLSTTIKTNETSRKPIPNNEMIFTMNDNIVSIYNTSPQHHYHQSTTNSTIDITSSIIENNTSDSTKISSNSIQSTSQSNHFIVVDSNVIISTLKLNETSEIIFNIESNSN